MPSVTQMSPGMSFFFARIFPLPFILVGAATLFFGGRSLHRAKESVAWPEANGQIMSSGVEYRRGDKGGGTYHAEIRYTFTVNGQTHSGNKIAFGDYGSSNPSHARGVVNRYPKDKSVSVRYMPTDPDVCILEPGIQGQAWALPGFGLLSLAVGTLMALFLPKAMKKQAGAEQGSGGDV